MEVKDPVSLEWPMLGLMSWDVPPDPVLLHPRNSYSEQQF